MSNTPADRVNVYLHKTLALKPPVRKSPNYPRKPVLKSVVKRAARRKAKVEVSKPGDLQTTKNQPAAKTSPKKRNLSPHGVIPDSKRDIAARPPKLPKSKQRTIDQIHAKPNKKQKEYWDKLSRVQQEKYLKEHPKSVLRQLPLKVQDGKKPGDKDGAGNEIFKSRTMTEPEKIRAMKRFHVLRKPHALDKGSKEREASAAAIEKDGPDALKEALPEEHIDKAIEELGSIKKNGKDSKNDDDEDDDDEFDRHSRHEDKHKNFIQRHPVLTAVAGTLLVAGIMGIAVAAVNPAFALYMGYNFVDKLPDILDTLISKAQASAIEPDKDEKLKDLCNIVGTYMRDADLPKNFLTRMQSEVGAADQ